MTDVDAVNEVAEESQNVEDKATEASTEKSQASNNRSESQNRTQEPPDASVESANNEEVMDLSSQPPLVQQFVANRMKLNVAQKLADVVEDADCPLIVDDIDERLQSAIASLPAKMGEWFVEQLKTINLIGVNMKAVFLSTLLKVLRERVRSYGAEMAMSKPIVHLPKIEDTKALLERTGYTLEVTVGQRKFGGPPPNWDSTSKKSKYEIYMSKVPTDCYEDQLEPILSKYGRLWDLRIMMSLEQGGSKGFLFASYCENEDAVKAAEELKNLELSGRKVNVALNQPVTRIFLGNIPKSKSKEEIIDELNTQGLGDGLSDVIVYSSTDGGATKNRGFCFVDYNDHKSVLLSIVPSAIAISLVQASDAKRKLEQGKATLWNMHRIQVDWAESQEEPDEETMSKVKSVFARHLAASVDENRLMEIFGKYGNIEKIKKIRDYAFIHYEERSEAEKAIAELNGAEIDGQKMELSFAKPQRERKDVSSARRGGSPSRGQQFGHGGRRGMPGHRGLRGGGGYGPDPYGPMMPPYSGYGAPPPMQGGGWAGGGFVDDFGFGGGYHDGYGGGYEGYPGYRMPMRGGGMGGGYGAPKRSSGPMRGPNPKRARGRF